MIDAQTRLVGLLGWPVAHSLSPAMHNAAFAALGLNYAYLPLPVHPDRLKTALLGLAAAGFTGFNATIPYKQAVLSLLDRVSPEAESVGAVNTILVRTPEDGRPVLCGENTDMDGFLRSLRLQGFDPAGKRALVVGAGGSSRAVAAGLLRSGVRSLTILNRAESSARSLVEVLQKTVVPGTQALNWGLISGRLVEEAASADLLVNTTPLGMWPDRGNSIWPVGLPLPGHLVVYDLVYNPLDTGLLQQARASGAVGISGLDMLVWQGALAFQKWTGVDAPVEVMRSACQQILRR